MSTFSVSRRALLGLGGGLAAAGALTLAGCSSTNAGTSSSSGGLSGVAKMLLPGDVPPGWEAVQEKLNTKLKAELGFTIEPQFINWSNYAQQALLKFTAGEEFDTALQALWLNMAQLAQQGALADLAGTFDKYSGLSTSMPAQLIKSNTWNGGHLWGVPQVNSAGRIHHMAIRQDLAEKIGQSSIKTYADWERYLYLVKEKGAGTIPYGAASNQTNVLAVPAPTSQFCAESWDDPHMIPLSFSGKSVFWIPAKDAKTTKSSKVIPHWEDERVVATFKRIRQYYLDGIINKDALNTDNATIKSQFAAGKYGAVWAITDGLSSDLLVALRKAIPTAMLANVAPFTNGLSAKPNQTFQADNLAVVNAKGGNVDRALALQNWLSKKENYDLLNYGIEGTDWKPVGDTKYEAVSKYSFPGFALAWRSGLARRTSYMTDTESALLDWAQKYENFTVDPFASFIPNSEVVRAELAAMTTVTTQYVNPLYYGVVDVGPQLDKLKKAAEGAGLAKLQAEMEKQANEYLSKNA